LKDQAKTQSGAESIKDQKNGLDLGQASNLAKGMIASMATRVRGQSKTLRWLTAALIAGKHVLLEDRPGTGKTTLAKTLSQSIGASFQRIQFTPDLLPSDILGVSVYEQDRRDFRFHPGPIFTQILLADEINRSSPRTQSALLEAMAEQQVTIEGKRHPLDPLYFVMATQNPVTFSGTFPLPEAQLDRFALKFGLGYLSAEDEVRLLMGKMEGESEPLAPCLQAHQVIELRKLTQKVRVGQELCRYVVDLVGGSRGHDQVQLGASPRASIDLVALARALALVDGLDYVNCDLIQELAVPCLAHRLVLDPALRHAGVDEASWVQGLVEQVPLPRG